MLRLVSAFGGSAHLILLTGKTHLTRARTADMATLARTVRAVVGLPLGFYRRPRPTQPIDFGYRRAVASPTD